MFRYLNQSELSDLRRNLKYAKDLYTISLLKRKFFKINFSEKSFYECMDFLEKLNFDVFSLHLVGTLITDNEDDFIDKLKELLDLTLNKLNKLITNDFTLEDNFTSLNHCFKLESYWCVYKRTSTVDDRLNKAVDKFIVNIHENLGKDFNINSEFIQAYLNTLTFFNKASNYFLSYLKDFTLERFDRYIFNLLCIHYNIPNDLKEFMNILAKGDNFFKEIYDDDDYDEYIDDIYDNAINTCEFDSVLEALAKHFDIFYISSYKAAMGTKEYYSNGLDIYFDDDFNQFKDQVPLTSDGYVEEDYDYFSIFESYGDMVFYIGKCIDDKLAQTLEFLSPDMSDEFPMTYSEVWNDKDIGYTKWTLNDNCAMQGFSYKFLNLLLISFGGF